MPRQLRLQYPGALYHVMNRGDLSNALTQQRRKEQKCQ
jgi:hypothetical protein